MPETPITPALTPEEWRDQRIVRGDTTYSGNGPTARLLGDALECAQTYDYEDSRSGWEGRDRQALAALALHGQPFGFTWEDVDAIRAVADGWTRDAANHEILPGLTAPERALRDRALAAADRLAALLPPRP